MLPIPCHERHNLHDYLCPIDPPVISFDRKSHLNVVLYASNDFNDEMNKETILCIIPNRADDTGVAEGVHEYPIFCIGKIKRGKRGSKEWLLKGFHQGENVSVLAMFTVLF